MLESPSAFSADVGMLGCEPPTTVNWAPRRIALGSKFDIESSSIIVKTNAGWIDEVGCSRGLAATIRR